MLWWRWLIRSNNRRIRKLAAGKLGNSKSRRALQALVIAVTDKDAYVRCNAAAALGKIGNPQAIEPLFKALADTYGNVRYEAAKALKQIDPNWDKSNGAKAAVPSFMEKLKDSDSDVRYGATCALGELREPAAIEALIAILLNKDKWVRIEAARALGVIGDPQAIEALVSTLTDDKDDVRSTAEKALERIDANWAASDGAKAAVPSLVAKLGDWNLMVQCNAAEVLGMVGGSQSVEPLVTALADESRHVRRIAAASLGRIGEAQAIGPLALALVDEDSDVRESAKWAVKEIDPKWMNSAAAKAAIPSLVSVLCSSNWRKHVTAMEALGMIGGSEVVEFLIPLLIDKNQDARVSVEEALCRVDPTWMKGSGARAAIPFVAAALKDECWDVREAAAAVLGKIGDRQAVEPLIGALSDETRRVVGAALKALGEIGDANAIVPLVTLAHNPDYAEEAIHILELLLEANSRSISEEDLTAIVNLKGIKKKAYGSAGMLSSPVLPPVLPSTPVMALIRARERLARERLHEYDQGNSGANNPERMPVRHKKTEGKLKRFFKRG